MQKQIYRVISLTITIAVILFGIIALDLSYNLYQNKSEDEIKTMAGIMTAQGLDPAEIAQLLEKSAPFPVRVTYVDAAGAVLFDNHASGLENHSDREEIEQAFRTGTGEATRLSQTLDKSLYYYAVSYQGGVLRLAREYRGIASVLLMMIPVICLVIGAVVMISTLVSIVMAERIVQPISRLVKQLDQMDVQGKRPVRIKTECEELKPIVSTIERQSVRLATYLSEMEQGVKVRREFSANVSHELKTPLTTIKGFGEMLEGGIINESREVRKYGGVIYRESSRLLSLINDIMRISEIEEKHERDLVEIDLYQMAADAIEILMPKAKEHQITLRLDGIHKMVHGHYSYISELFLNLIDNSIKYNKPGGHVWIEIREDEANGIISVRDDGLGIEEKYQERIFERFYRVDKSRSKQIGGTGLGLSIVKHIVSYHQGTVALHSVPDQGTEFVVYFPN